MKELQVTIREKSDNVTSLRNTGYIPAVLYGPKEDSISVSVKADDFIQIWEEVGGSAIIDLKGAGENKDALIHDVTWDPVKGIPIHADFYCIEHGKKLTITVPLDFVGEAPVEKEDGIVVKVMHEIEIEVRPRDIPQDIKVPLELLTELNSSITIADLKLPETITPLAESTDNVASVTQAQEEKVEEERSIDDVEIESEEKNEEGGDTETKADTEK